MFIKLLLSVATVLNFYSCKSRVDNGNEISEQDSLPNRFDNDLPRGRSYFDYMMFERSSNRFEIPFPLDRLQKKMQEKSQDKLETHGLLIPRGRALTRNLAGQKYFRYPRVIVFPSSNIFDNSVLKEGEVIIPKFGVMTYVAFHELDDQLEVISYNEEMGRFEFQIVRDYAEGKEPKIFYANRKLCTSCHDAGSPLTLRFPCNETSNDSALNAKIVQALIDGKKDPKNYFGIDVTDRRAMSISCQSFSDESDQPNNLNFVQRQWRIGCQLAASPASCRKKILLDAAKGEISNLADIGIPLDKLAKDMMFPQGWVLGDFPERMWRPNENFSKRSQSLSQLLEDVPKELSPIGGIKTSPGGAFRIPLEFFDVPLRKVGNLLGEQNLEKIVMKVADTNPEFFKNDVFRREEFLFEVFKSYGKQPPQSYFASQSKMPEPELAFEPRELQFGNQKELQLLYSYCSGCHAQEGDYMDVQTVEELRSNIDQKKSLIIKRLDWASAKSPMPPSSSPEYRQLRDVRPKDLEAMREYVGRR